MYPLVFWVVLPSAYTEKVRTHSPLLRIPLFRSIRQIHTSFHSHPASREWQRSAGTNEVRSMPFFLELVPAKYTGVDNRM